MTNIETHPLQPFLPKSAKILILGSFPPKKARWSMEFFYPNMQNDMWRIFGLIFYNNKEYFVTNKKFDAERIKEFCANNGIALYDTAKSIIRLKDNASDHFLEVVEKINLEKILLEIPQCKTIVVTGKKATDTILGIISTQEPEIGSFSEFEYIGRAMRLYRMPSSSRAYPKPLEEKALIYKKLFD